MNDELTYNLRSLLGTIVSYCRRPQMFPIMIDFDGDNGRIYTLVCWQYWELTKCDALLATDYDENYTSLNEALHSVVNSKVVGVSVDIDYSLMFCFDNGVDLCFYTQYRAEPDNDDDPIPNWELFNKVKRDRFEITTNLELKIERNYE